MPILTSKEKKLYLLAKQALVSAGDILMKRFKEFHHDLDFAAYGQQAYEAAEKVQMEILHNIFKGHGYVTPLLSEEGSSGAPIWRLNPLDGVSNFSHHIPLFGCSLSLQKDGKTVLSMVYLPVTKEFFHAVEDEGVFLNGRKLSPLSAKHKDAAQLFVTYCHSRDQEDLKKAHDYLGKIGHRVREMNKITCASLGVSLLLRGVYDGFIAPGLSPLSYEAAVHMARMQGADVHETKDGTVMVFAPGVENVLKDALK